MHLTALFTMPKTKDWQDALAVQLAWHALAVVIPLGWERGCWLPLPVGAPPQVLRSWRGELETVARRAEAVIRTVVNECILIAYNVKTSGEVIES
jgi:hypothetical protein